jgi:integrase
MEQVYHPVNDSTVVYMRGKSWYARIHLGSGKYFWRSLRTDRQEQAEQAARELFAETQFKIKHGVPVVGKRFMDCWRKWFEVHEALAAQGRHSLAMIRIHKQLQRKWASFWGDTQIANITPQHLDRAVEWRRQLRATRDTNIQLEMMCQKQVLRWCVRQGWLDRVPDWTFVARKRLVRPAFDVVEYRKLYRALRKFTKAAANEHYKWYREQLQLFVLLLANSGLRPGEAYNLRIRDCEEFRDGKGRLNYRLIVRGKTGERDCIPRAVAHVYIKKQIARRNGADINEPLFVNRSGERITTLLHGLNRVLKAEGILPPNGGKFSIYSLRHFFITMSLRRGVPIYLVARNCGTSVGVIEHFYGKNATPMSVADILGG